MQFPMWRGHRLVPSTSAQHEMMDLGLDLHDVENVLECGFDCHKGKRKLGTVERCTRVNGKVLRVVVVEDEVEYPDGELEPVWVIIHAGISSQWR